MTDPSNWIWAVMPATDDTLLAEAEDVSLVLPEFRLMWLPKNQGLCSFNPKTYFATRFWPKTPIKHPKNHDKLSHGLKETP